MILNHQQLPTYIFDGTIYNFPIKIFHDKKLKLPYVV